MSEAATSEELRNGDKTSTRQMLRVVDGAPNLDVAPDPFAFNRLEGSYTDLVSAERAAEGVAEVGTIAVVDYRHAVIDGQSAQETFQVRAFSDRADFDRFVRDEFQDQQLPAPAVTDPDFAVDFAGAGTEYHRELYVHDPEAGSAQPTLFDDGTARPLTAAEQQAVARRTHQQTEFGTANWTIGPYGSGAALADPDRQGVDLLEMQREEPYDPFRQLRVHEGGASEPFQQEHDIVAEEEHQRSIQQQQPEQSRVMER